MKRTLMVALAALSLAGFARAEDSSLVVVGRGASLEEAVAQPHAPSYRLLVMREELLRLRANPAEEEARRLLNQARRHGAVVFVCERDLRAERLQRSDLVPGVVAVAAANDWVNGTPSEADLALRRLCS
jgi:hypothetical protein